MIAFNSFVKTPYASGLFALLAISPAVAGEMAVQLKMHALVLAAYQLAVRWMSVAGYKRRFRPVSERDRSTSGSRHSNSHFRFFGFSSTVPPSFIKPGFRSS